MVDFRQARLGDVNWWRRTNWLIGELAVEEELAALRVAYQFQCALAAHGNLTKESFDEAQQNIKALSAAMTALIRPWAGKPTAAKRRQVDDLIALYKQVYGDPKDPEFQRKLAADLAADEARRRAIPKETDEQRVERLMQARDEGRR